MKKRSLFLLCTALVLGFLSSSASAGSDGPATKTVRRVNSGIAKTLSAKSKSNKDETQLLNEARAQLGDFLDIDELGKRAMKDHWAKLTPAQQSEFLTLLRELIETNYLQGLRSNVKYKVRYLGEQEVGDYVQVQTVVNSQRKGRPLQIEVNYLLSKQGQSWRTFDIATDGVGLVENYRAMFNSIISKSGPDELLKRMRSKLAALSR